MLQQSIKDMNDEDLGQILMEVSSQPDRELLAAAF
jgi:hypothetical protein